MIDRQQLRHRLDDAWNGSTAQGDIEIATRQLRVAGLNSLLAKMLARLSGKWWTH